MIDSLCGAIVSIGVLVALTKGIGGLHSALRVTSADRPASRIFVVTSGIRKLQNGILWIPTTYPAVYRNEVHWLFPAEHLQHLKQGARVRINPQGVITDLVEGPIANSSRIRPDAW